MSPEKDVWDDGDDDDDNDDVQITGYRWHN